MADTKISALADVGTLADGDLFAIDDVSATTTKSATATEVNTYVRSVAPGLPTGTSPTSRKILVSDGTNYVASTETWATPGSANNVLTSDGTNWISSARTTFAHNSPAQALGTGDTYVTNSGINVPGSGQHRAGMLFRWRVGITKTAAGTATYTWIIRFGTNGTTADTARVTFATSAIQTGVIDNAIFDISAYIKTTGASGVIVGVMQGDMHKAAGTTGFAGNVDLKASSAFDLTVANSIIGLSVAPGASAAWTVNEIITEIIP